MVSHQPSVPSPLRLERGVTMIEVLVSIVIIAFGLLGMAGLQMRMQMSEFEAYQRSQALLLLNDIASRLNVNRNNADSYLVSAGTPLGAGMTCPTAVSTRAQQDLREWCLSLQGAAEIAGGQSKGAMTGGRGCVEKVDDDYLITVAWQGLTPISAPPASVACGQNNYNGAAGSACINDLCRRVVTTLVRVGKLL